MDSVHQVMFPAVHMRSNIFFEEFYTLKYIFDTNYSYFVISNQEIFHPAVLKLYIINITNICFLR